MERCSNCPADPGTTCTAILRTHPRYCQLVDPDHPDYNPEYIPIVKGNSHRSPSPVEMARSAIKAAGRFVASGGQIASDEVKAEREAICRACPNHAPDTDQCKICGCMLKFKRAMASESCPDSPSRWGSA